MPAVDLIAFDIAPTPATTDSSTIAPPATPNSECVTGSSGAAKDPANNEQAGVSDFPLSTHLRLPECSQVEANDSVVDFPVARVYVPIETPDDPCSPSRPVICEPVAAHPTVDSAHVKSAPTATGLLLNE
jgi:hypothetical protein